MPICSLAQAAREIKQTCELHTTPFFFMIGAGVSAPIVPLASQIVRECKKQVGNNSPDPGRMSPMDEYSFWLRTAFPGPADRQQYFRRLIEGKPITLANLRLAHILLSKRIASLAVTTNFDDFLSRALTLFGQSHIVCDHPSTISRIDPRRTDLQIVHIHGTYWFYDCCNLHSEVVARSRRSGRLMSTADFLNELLRHQSPLIVGYSGWEEDVFMQCLSRAIRQGLKHNVYWFCYSADAASKIPRTIRRSDRTYLVLPEDEHPRHAVDAGLTNYLTNVAQRFSPAANAPPLQPAEKTFEAIIRTHSIDSPLLTVDPLRFFEESLVQALPKSTLSQSEPDAYVFTAVLDQVRKARVAMERASAVIQKQLDQVLTEFRSARYEQAVEVARSIIVADLDRHQLRILFQLLKDVCAGFENASYAVVHAVGIARECVMQIDENDKDLQRDLDQLSINAGFANLDLERVEQALADFESVLLAIGTDAGNEVSNLYAQALYGKASAFAALRKPEDALTYYDLAIDEAKRNASATRLLVSCMTGKAAALEVLGRRNEAVLAYGHALSKFNIEDDEIADVLARAAIGKALLLDDVGDHNGSITELHNLIDITASRPALQGQRAWAIVFLAGKLGDDQRYDYALELLNRVITEYKEIPAIAAQGARAYAYRDKVRILKESGNSDAAIQTCDAMVREFDDDGNPVIQEAVARALMEKARIFADMKRTANVIETCNSIANQFGKTVEPGTVQVVVEALVQKGEALRLNNELADALSCFDYAIQRADGNAELEEQRVSAWFSKASILEQQARFDDAVDAHQNLVERFGKSQVDIVLGFVAASLSHIGNICSTKLHKPKEALRAYDLIIKRTRKADHPFLREQFANATLSKASIIGFENPDAAFKASLRLSRELQTSEGKEQREFLNKARRGVAYYGLLSGKKFLQDGLAVSAKNTLLLASEALGFLKPFDTGSLRLLAAYICFLLDDVKEAENALSSAPPIGRAVHYERIPGIDFWSIPQDKAFTQWLRKALS